MRRYDRGQGWELTGGRSRTLAEDSEEPAGAEMWRPRSVGSPQRPESALGKGHNNGMSAGIYRELWPERPG